MANDDKPQPDPPQPTDPTVTSAGPPPAFQEELVFTEFGDYEVLGEIARGGVGVVYRARQRGLDRIVALKVLQGGTTASSEQVQRFMHEAQAAAKLQHPNIVPIHDFGVKEGQHYFTMDFIEGHSLADEIEKGPMATRTALEIARQVSDALHYAHERGIIHRDIKPGNILIDNDGRVKVTDFGLAKELDRDQMHLTVTGQVMGTPRYMSPEQAGGRTAEADQRSDVFSLGATLYEMLTGRPAFEADNVMQMLTNVCNEDPPLPNKVNPKVHRDAATICMKAIEKDPARRFQTSSEMTQDIERFLAGEPIEARVAGVVGRTFRKVKRYSKVIAANVLVVAFLIYLLVFYLNSRPSLLDLNVTTKDADVALDGNVLPPEQLGTQIKLNAGKHRVLVALEPDYDPQEITFETEPAESRTLSIGLERRKGVLVVRSDPPDAAITLLGANDFRMPLIGPVITQELPTGRYAVLVHKQNYLAHDIDVLVENRATNTYTITLPPIKVWSVPTSASVVSVPVVHDLDGDGVAEAVAGDDGGSVYCVSTRSGVTKWVHRVDDAVQAPVAVSNVGGNNHANVLVGTTGKKLYCLDGVDGHELWKQPFEAGGAILGAILQLDVNGDGINDALIGASDGSVYAVSGLDGTGIWTNSTKGRVESTIGLTRIGATEVVIVGNANKSLCCFDARRGELLWSVNLWTPLFFPPRFETINGKPAVLLVTPKSPGDVRTRTAVSLADHKLIGISDKFPNSYDLDGDGQLKQIVVTEAGTTCYASDGTNQLWHSEYPAVGAYTADIDGDGTLDLVFNNGPDEIIAISGRDGSLLGHIKLDAATGRGFTLDDVDHDGMPDVIVGAAQNIYCFSFNGGRRLSFTRGNGFYDAPFVNIDGGRFITKDSAGEIACYDPQLTDPVWRAKTSTQPSPYVGVAVGQGIIVDADAPTRLVRAFAATTGKVLWQMRLPTKADVIGAPAIGPDTAIVSDGVAGLYAFWLTNGVTRWSISLSNVTAAAAISGDSVLISAQAETNYTLFSLSLTNGSIRWQTGFPDPIPTPPAMVDVNGDGVADAIAVCDNGFTYAINGKDGTVLWLFKHTDYRLRTRSGVVAIDLDGDGFPEGVLATPEGNVICLDLKSGKPRWCFALKEPVLGMPVCLDMNGGGIPAILVGTMKRTVHCISGKGDAELWSYEVGSPIRYCAPLTVKNPKSATPLVVVGTGPPEYGLYVLRGEAPRLKDRGWSGPWKEVTALR